VRRPGGARAGGYPGAAAIEATSAGAAPCKRVGLVGLERVPVREGAPIVDAHGHKLGTVTSGTLGPTVNQPIAMAYLPLEPRQRAARGVCRGARQAPADARDPDAVRPPPLQALNPSPPEPPNRSLPMTTMYTPDHEWINIEDHEAAVVGITHHAQDALGDVVFVDLPEVGRSYKKGDVAGVVES
jgi:hypothetical protein